MTEAAESFQVHKFRVVRPANKPFLLYAFGDVHKFAPMHSEEHWKNFLNEAKRHPDALFIGLGDYIELFSGSERKGLQAASLHESSIETMEEWYDSLIDQFYEDIKFARGRILGLIDGNHTLHFLDGSTAVQRLCRRLGCKYLGDAAFIKLSLTRQKERSGPSMTIFASHGIGGASRTIGGDVTPMTRMELIADDIDLFVAGHTHQRWAIPFTRVRLKDLGEDGLKVEQRRGYFVRTGSFLRNYQPNSKSYASRKMLRPSDLGAVPVTITCVRQQSKKKQVETIDLRVTV